MADDLARRQHLRRVLATPGQAHPELKEPVHKHRLTRYVQAEIDQEGPIHDEHYNPTPQDGQTE